MLSFVCKFCLLEMEFWKKNSAQQIISPSLLYPWIWDFEYEYNPNFDLGMGDWISNGDNDDLLFSNYISNGDNDDSLTFFHKIARQQELQNGYWTLQAALSSCIT